jgi:hypothetical protein
VEVFADIRYPFLEVIVEEILKLASKLYASRSAAHDNHMQKSLNFFWILVFECCCFATVHYSSSNSLCVIDFFEEEGVFSNTRNAYAK